MVAAAEEEDSCTFSPPAGLRSLLSDVAVFSVASCERECVSACVCACARTDTRKHTGVRVCACVRRVRVCVCVCVCVCVYIKPHTKRGANCAVTDT